MNEATTITDSFEQLEFPFADKLLVTVDTENLIPTLDALEALRSEDPEPGTVYLPMGQNLAARPQ